MAKYLRPCTIFLHSLFFIPLAQANQWGWVPREALSTEQQASLNRYCRGSYINNWQATDTSDTTLVADMMQRNDKGVVHLEGNAEIQQPESTLSAQTIDGIPDQYYQAEGDVRVQNSNQLILSDSSYISSNGVEDTRFNNAQFLSYQSGIRGASQSLSRNEQGVVFIEEGFYTSCEPTQESWKLYGSAIELDPNTGFGTAKHVRIHIANIPVFYVPWLRFPIDDQRHTGFLFPSFSYSGNDGLSVSAPVYWNIAPNYDATFTPNFVQHKGEGFDIELRHLGEYDVTTYEQSSFYDDDDGEQTLQKFTSQLTFTDNITAGVTLEDNPTTDLYPEVNSTSIGEKDDYERSAYVAYSKDNFSSKITQRRYFTPDSSNNEPFDWLPRVESSYRVAGELIDYSLAAQYTDFYDPAEDDFDGQRSVINQDLSFDFSNAWGSFSPGVLVQYRDYNINSYTDSDSTSSITHASGYFDSSIAFERAVNVNNGIWRQTLVPRLSYLNAPYVDQDDIPDFDASEPTLTYSQAFSHERFSGDDRIGDTEQLALGIESSLYDSNNIKRWSFKVGQVFYLADRYVDISGDTDESTATDSDSYSDILTSTSYNGDKYSLTANLNYDLENQDSGYAQVVVKLEPTEDIDISLSYLYTIDNTDSDDDAHQANISTIFPLTRNWSVFTQHTYDFVAGDTTKEVGGLGYENCCVKVSLSYQDWLDDDDEYDRGIFLQFILRSLSTVGSQNTEASIADDYWNEGQVGY
ncbi:LPS-assembly protein LptD [Marinomonas dokdonensis]|uniref:LPS-assembly protein LptD n=1 Tax=Marinomonas dokdonensis TaxID=328224 RepID=UPI0040557D30